MAKKEEEIGKLRDEIQQLKEENLFLQDGIVLSIICTYQG
jgi:hypothetical protein